MKLRWHRHGRSAEEIAGLPVVTAEEMRTAEQALFARGTPSFDVMAAAGRAVVEAIRLRWPTPFRRALILAGPGRAVLYGAQFLERPAARSAIFR